MSDLLKTFARNLKAVREQRGLTQEALSHEVGYQSNNVSLLENARRDVTLKKIEELSHALGVSPATLIAADDADQAAASLKTILAIVEPGNVPTSSYWKRLSKICRDILQSIRKNKNVSSTVVNA